MYTLLINFELLPVAITSHFTTAWQSEVSVKALFEPTCANARWALKYRFLSVHLSVCPEQAQVLQSGFHRRFLGASWKNIYYTLTKISLVSVLFFPKSRLDINSYLEKYWGQKSETSSQYRIFIGAFWKNTNFTLIKIFLVSLLFFPKSRLVINSYMLSK